MIVADDQAHPTQAASRQVLQKGPPMHFLIAQRHRDAYRGAFALPVYPAGNTCTPGVQAQVSVPPHPGFARPDGPVRNGHPARGK